MTISSKSKIDYAPTHPGIILRDVLVSHGMTQKELSIVLGKPSPIINDIIKGKRKINTEFAILLHAVIPEITAEEWLNMQSQYDIYELKNKEEIADQEKNISVWKELEKYVNVQYLKKATHLDDTLKDSNKSILKYLRLHSVDELKDKLSESMSYFRKSDKLEVDPKNLLTWLCVVNHNNSEYLLKTSSYSKIKIPSLIDELNLILYQNEDTINRVQRALSAYGIKFLIQEKLDKMPVDGMAFWSGDNPTIVLTTRYKRIDNFAFTLFHELGHVVKHLYKDTTTEFLDDTHDTKRGGKESSEEEANNFASKAIWGDVDYEQLFNQISIPFAAGNFLKSISKTYKINLGVVTGQYQHYCAVSKKSNTPYAICRQFIEKIK